MREGERMGEGRPDAPACPDCGSPMEPVVMERDSAMLPDGYRWVRFVCPDCDDKEE